MEASRLEYKAVYPNYWTVGDRILQKWHIFKGASSKILSLKRRLRCPDPH
ncbi:hypothetical protein [Nostoc sp. T09]|nr:hypothetical protein [Nostoc sp. T09]